MDARRAPRAVIDPKVRRVGFFAPPDRSQSGPPHPISLDVSPAANSLSPVMIPPPRHLSENLSLHGRPAPTSPSVEESVTAGSYSSSSEFFPPMSPAPSSYTNSMVVDDRDFFDGSKMTSSSPHGGVDLTATKASSVLVSELTTVAVVNADSLAIGGEVFAIFALFSYLNEESTCFELNFFVKVK